MEFIKRNWWWLLLIPVAAFFVYRYFKKKIELSEKMKNVRAARVHLDNEVVTENQNNDNSEN